MKHTYLAVRHIAPVLVLALVGCTTGTDSTYVQADGAASDSIAVSFDGVRVHFDQRGTGEPALLFVHGWANSGSVWDAQMAHFSARHRVIAVDLPGFGKSGHGRTEWTIEAFGEDVAAVVRELGLDRVVLIGFSLGASVVVEAAMKVPEAVIGVVLVDDLKDPEMTYPTEIVAFMDSVLMDLVTTPSNEKLVGGGFYRMNPEASYERVLAMLSSHRNEARIGWRETIGGYFRWLNEACIGSLEAVRAPIVSVVSDAEPVSADGFRRHVSTYRAEVIPNAGHLLMWDAPAEFNRLLEESIAEFDSLARGR